MSESDMIGGKKGDAVSRNQSLIYDTVWCNTVDIGQFALKFTRDLTWVVSYGMEQTQRTGGKKYLAYFFHFLPHNSERSVRGWENRLQNICIPSLCSFGSCQHYSGHLTATAAEEQRLLFHCRRSFCGQSAFHFTGTI